jgi:hypothetical protein
MTRRMTRAKSRNGKQLGSECIVEGSLRMKKMYDTPLLIDTTMQHRALLMF